jgi:Mlc titration factor MtfA (ptsG expression regulator)
LYFETSGRSNWQALRFQWGFRKLERIFEGHKQSLANAEVGIRSYAFTNIFEFFAVLLEHFFESPEELAKEQPEMYSILRSMLNQ